jgi:uncharacterized protein YaaN involved in tellurite resistance
MSTTTTTTTAAPAFTLTPPEVITPVEPVQAIEAVPLKPEIANQVDEQVQRFIAALEKEDLHSEPFKAKLDSAFQLGRQEISVAANLMQGSLMQRNFVGVTDTPAYKAIAAIREQLDELNPGKDGDLLQPRKLLGLIPFGNKLEAYFRKFESAASQLQTSMTQLYAAKDGIQKDVIDIESTRGKLWEAMQSLAAAARFARTLDTRLAERVEQLKPTDPMKAKALEQEVLFYARQNLADIQTQQAVCVNGYLALDVLKKTGREMMIGCDRVATTGMSALAVAQTVARATGNQIEVMKMLQGVNTTIGNLINQTGQALNQHVDQTAEFAANPMLGIEQIQSMFDQTFQAMDAMDNFRSKAIATMGANNKLIEAQLQRADSYVDRTRQQQAKAAIAGGDAAGPVKL